MIKTKVESTLKIKNDFMSKEWRRLLGRQKIVQKISDCKCQNLGLKTHFGKT